MQIIRERTLLDRILILTLFFGVVLTDLLFLGASCAPNPYVFDIAAGVESAGVYMLLHLVIFCVAFSPAFLMSDRGKLVYSLFVAIFFSTLSLIYIAYYRFFNTMPSVSMVNLINFNNSSVPDSASNFMIPLRWYDFLFFVYLLPFVVLKAINASYKFNHGLIRTKHIADLPRISPSISSQLPTPSRRSISKFAIAVIVVCAILTIVCAPIVSSVLAQDSITNSKSFAEDTVAYTPLGGFVKDIGEVVLGTPPLTDKEREGIEDYFDWSSQYYQSGSYTGTLAGKNVIFVQLESIENFVIGMVVDGQEITPNLNSLAGSGYYFPNVHDQVTSGNSSDCDFLVTTSLLHANRRVSLKSYADNTYNSLPRILSSLGYNTTYYTGTPNSNWGYENITKGIGYEHFDADYVINETTRLNTYLSDGSYFMQTVPKMLEEGRSFVGDTLQLAHMVCCSSHAPYVIPEDLQTLDLPSSLEGTVVGDYLQAVHYTDTQVGLFVDELRKAGILDNTVLCFIGDHLGPHKYYPEEFKDVPHVAFNTVKDDYDETVPFIVYSGAEDVVPTRFDVEGGQIDVMPTLLDLLGVDSALYSHTAMGRSLVATKASFAVSGTGKIYGTPTDADEYMLSRALKIADLILENDYFSNR